MLATPNLDGIDVSHWNVITDWDDIPDFDLWCMKATEGQSFRSPVFDERWQELHDRDVKYRGAYHWLRSDSPMLDQFENLEHAIDDHGGLQVGEFIMLDWETTPGIKDLTVAQVEEWLEFAEARWPGRIIVYCSDWVPGFKTWRRKHKTYPLWYANYRLVRDDRGGEAESDEWGAAVWQWTSTELVDGFSAGIDGNEVADWDVLAAISGYDMADEVPVDQTVGMWPPYNPPAEWGLYPLHWPKPELHATPARSDQADSGHVHYLQSVLRHVGYPITVDNWFGTQTEHYVRRFQKARGFVVDGWVGQQTWRGVDSSTLM